MSLTEILSVAAPLMAVIATLAGLLWQRELGRSAKLEEESQALENENKRLVAAILVAATTEELREKLSEYLRGNPRWDEARRSSGSSGQSPFGGQR